MEREVSLGWESGRQRKKEMILMLTGFIFPDYSNYIRLSELLEKLDGAQVLANYILACVSTAVSCLIILQGREMVGR